jgi:hypothetical protein
VARHVGLLRQHGLVRAMRRGGDLLLELDGTVTPRLLEVVCHWVHPETGEQFAAADAKAEATHATA